MDSREPIAGPLIIILDVYGEAAIANDMDAYAGLLYEHIIAPFFG
jgi:hypothetical protein